MFCSIKKVLPDLLNIKQNWKSNLLYNWPNIIGQLAKQMRIEKIDSKTLIIGVYEPAWMQELFLLSKFIIDKVNSSLGEDYIENLRFKLVEKNKALKSKNQNIEKKIKKNCELNLNQKLVLDHIKDEQLKEHLYNFFLNCTVNF